MSIEEDISGISGITDDSYEKAKIALLEKLSDFEKKVLEYWLNNIPYKQIADELSCSSFCIIKSLIRIKRKAIKLKEDGSLNYIEGFEK
jgi:hypothetical protein